MENWTIKKIKNKNKKCAIFQKFLETVIFRPDVKKNRSYQNVGRPSKPSKTFQEKGRQGQYLESKAILNNSPTKSFAAHCNAVKLLAHEMGYDDCSFLLDMMAKAEDPIQIGKELRKAYEASKKEGTNNIEKVNKWTKLK